MNATMERIDPRDIAIVELELGSDVKNFAQLQAIARALNDIDKYSNYLFRRHYDFELPPTEIEFFRINSKPRAKFHIDAGWLAVLITLGAGYTNIKENIPIIIKDAEYIIHELSEEADELLEDVKEIIHEIAEDSEDPDSRRIIASNAYAILRGDEGIRIIKLEANDEK